MHGAAIVAAALTAQTWTLAVGGDIMLNQVSPGRGVFKGLGDAFSGADVAYANLEIPLTDHRGATRFKTAADLRARTQYILKASPQHIGEIASAGFDLLSLGNNHAMDYGYQGLKDMTSLLDGKRIEWAGAGKNRREAEKVAVKRLPGGIRVGMISALAFVGSGGLNKCGPATEDGPGVAVFRFEGVMGPAARAEVARRVAEAKKKCDFLIVAPHWGIEKQTKPREWQLTLGRALIDAGADLVAGTHPHVLQGREIYKGRPILYSTGNLVGPRGGTTAVYTFEFRGRQMVSWDIKPAAYSGGRVSLVSGKGREAAKQRIEALDRLVPAASRRR